MFDKARVLTTKTFKDDRGSHKKFYGNVPQELHIDGFNIHEVFMTTNKKNTIRGMHFQETHHQAKIIKVITGSLIVNVVNLNRKDPDFGEVFSTTLTADSLDRVYVPGDWALGYQAMEEDTRVLYLAGSDFVGSSDTGIDPFDKDLKLNWTVDKENAILSERDKDLQTFNDFVRGK